MTSSVRRLNDQRESGTRKCCSASRQIVLTTLTEYRGVRLTATQYGDKRVLSDHTLQRLLRHFNQYKLGNADLYKADMLGDAYEYLIKQFADDAGKKGGEFYTPKGVVQLVVRLLDPRPGMSVYDPTCGSGGMLVESAHHIAELPGGTLLGGKPNVMLYGQEKNLGTWAIAKLNLYGSRILRLCVYLQLQCRSTN